MQLIITEEDREFIDLVAERFDPGKVIDRPAGISDEDWATYLKPNQIGLRQEVEAALITRALQEAGFMADEPPEDVHIKVVGLLGYESLPSGSWDGWFELGGGAVAQDRADAIVRNEERAVEQILAGRVV
jgi:hypothetical protein